MMTRLRRASRIVVPMLSGLVGLGVNLTTGSDQIAPIQPAAIVRDERAAQEERSPVVSSLALDHSGSLLASAGDDHLVRIWDATTFRLITRLAGHSDWVQACVFLPGSPHLVSGGHDGQLILWDLSGLVEGKSTPPSRVVLRRSEAIRSLAASPDGKFLAVGTFEPKVLVLRLPQFELVATLSAKGGDTRALAFSPDNLHLSGGTRTGWIHVWQTGTWTPVREYQAHSGRVRALAFSPSGQGLASAGEDRKLALWQRPSFELLARVDQPAIVFAVAWWDEARLVIAGTDNTLRLINLPSGQEAERLSGHTGTVTALICRPGQNQVISAGYDTTIRLWSTGIRESVALRPR